MSTQPSPSPPYHTAPHTPEVSMTDVDDDKPSIETAPYKYCAAKDLPSEILRQTKIDYEERLFWVSMRLENELVSSPLDTGDGPFVFVAPTSHIALACTLLVHPDYTTRPKDKLTHFETLTLALTYLRNILAIVGPGNARLHEAFEFKRQSSRRGYGSRNPRPGTRASSTDSYDSENEEIEGVAIAADHSLWERAQDFWHAVGWAFNCSVLHPERWEYWKIWLRYMIDVIDADWLEREHLDQKNPGAKDVFQARSESILSQYVSHNGRAHIKRVIKSIFANGEGKNLDEFPEIFSKETAGPRKQDARKRQKIGDLDLENGKFGDYEPSDDDDTDDDTDALNSSQPESSQQIQEENEPTHDDEDSPSLKLGGRESVILRIRLMSLLSRASFFLPDDAIPIRELYERFGDNLVQLPLEPFSLIINANSVPDFPLAGLSTLCQMTISRFIECEAPENTEDTLDVLILNECFLPWTARNTGIEDNTKLSLLIETLLRIYVKQPTVKYDTCLEDLENLKAAVEEGIRARETKVGKKRKSRPKSGRGEGISGWDLLKASGERMLALMPAYERKVMEAKSSQESVAK